MKREWERRDILLLLILIAICFDIILRLPISQSIADTFRTDSCITEDAGQKPEAYMHVVPHPPEE